MTLNYALSDLVLPPTSLVVVTIAGALVLRRHKAVGIGLVLFSQVVLLALSLPLLANALARSLEPPPVTSTELKSAEAIVILGGGRNRGSPDWGGETVKTYTLQRLRYGARLARETGLPVFVSGGMPEGGTNPEGTLMRDILDAEFSVPVRDMEITSETTAENASMTATKLVAAGFKRVALVTDAMHMPRARRSFERWGIEVVACPTAYAGQRPFSLYQLVPGSPALVQSHIALREWISLLYYRLRDF